MDVEGFRFQIRFHVMKTLTKEEGLEKLLREDLIKEMVTRSFLEKEAKGARAAIMTLRRIPQMLYRACRVEENNQHYCITKVSEDININ